MQVMGVIKHTVRKYKKKTMADFMLKKQEFV